MPTQDVVLSRKPLILLSVSFLLAAALVVNRSSLPHGWLPEYRQTAETARVFAAMEAGAIPEFGDNDRIIHLQGNDTLFVGDSITRSCPDTVADVISLPGATTQEISTQFTDTIQNRRYERIILWPGNAHFHNGGNVDDYLRYLASMVTLAEQHADSVVVITPVPWRKVPQIRQLERLNQLIPDVTWWAAHRAKAMFADNTAGVAVFDASAFRSKRILDGSFYRLYDDRFHLNRVGTLALLDAVTDSTPAPVAHHQPAPSVIGAISTGA